MYIKGVCKSKQPDEFLAKTSRLFDWSCLVQNVQLISDPKYGYAVQSRMCCPWCSFVGSHETSLIFLQVVAGWWQGQRSMESRPGSSSSSSMGRKAAAKERLQVCGATQSLVEPFIAPPHPFVLQSSCTALCCSSNHIQVEGDLLFAATMLLPAIRDFLFKNSVFVIGILLCCTVNLIMMVSVVTVVR